MTKMKKINISAIDLFCGIGGLSYGLKKVGIKVKAGIDADTSCKFAYEKNIKGDFIGENIKCITGDFLRKKYWQDETSVKLLVGCAPCQPFSTHSNKIKNKEKSDKWNLLKEFERIIAECNPDIISMENVPNLAKKSVFKEFINFLSEREYYLSYSNVFCPNYGIPQKRRRLVLLASTFSDISIIPPTHTPKNYKTTRDAIGMLPPVNAGGISKDDPLHKTLKLSDLNLQRMKASKPNGTWKDWDEALMLECHKKPTGQSYTAVYGRMGWDEPSSTITTQFYSYGTGRFGHPEQDRALTIREAALLQTFPKEYVFFNNPDEVKITQYGVHIGNAVPTDLGKVIGRSIINHINKN